MANSLDARISELLGSDVVERYPVDRGYTPVQRFWLRSLAAEGGPLPGAVLPDAPNEAAVVAGFFAARAGLPVIPAAPRVRAIQLQQLRPALAWACGELGLSLPAW